ncbi:low molecular weight phosphotyrosine protein phosphatase [Shewanella sp. AS1]|uniref:low molecular weight protein-tyrosine-phosphatase n=1 Tax=Shewanella sp. AS1 TaxID=2907626 RepID=UPI001F217978|nr:low molecular weight protein-tyrosine-phosphatase [Shewanella sp. AS1]MCE9678352.1 low molecular weight phosphotyrosine protein phosphatase [Shewanella sp. AS1]
MKRINSVLFVCMGNICRSPTAEAIFKAKAARRGVAIEVDSAGTIDYHQGEQSDRRARAAGERRGYDFSSIRARGVSDYDFAHFDLILAADNHNMRDLMQRCPVEHRHKLALMLSFAKSDHTEVPDPYYGGDKGFELVLDLLEQSCDRLLDNIQYGSGEL